MSKEDIIGCVENVKSFSAGCTGAEQMRKKIQLENGC